MSSKVNKLVEYMVLPPLDTELEFSYLKRINTIFLLSLTAHLPIFSFYSRSSYCHVRQQYNFGVMSFSQVLVYIDEIHTRHVVLDYLKI